jgi:hypothetical protein
MCQICSAQDAFTVGRVDLAAEDVYAIGGHGGD